MSDSVKYSVQFLKDKLAKDSQLSLTTIQSDAANNAKLYADWIQINIDINIEIIKIKTKKDKIIKERLDFYTGRSDEICMNSYEKSELKYVLAADPSIIEINVLLLMLEEKSSFCKYALDCIKNRGFGIKNIIEDQKFRAGD